jgi:LysR family transcriptional regulator, low CO2-responsive transcriptional regulator
VKNLSIRQLRIFTSAARHNSFARAAEELHLTAPAVSMQMKDLEADLSISLFTREGRGVCLTSAGEYFLVYARRILSALKEAESMMTKLQGVETGNLSIGLVSTAIYILPQLLAGFRKTHPGVSVVIEVRNREDLIKLMREDTIDIAIMGKPPKDLDVVAQAFADHPHAFIASPSHRLASHSTLKLDMLDQEEIIVREAGSGTRLMMLSTIEMSSNETVKQAVMADLGISFVSLHTVGLELAHGELCVLNVHDTPIIRTWYVVSRTKTMSRAAQDFRDFVLAQGGSLLEAFFASPQAAVPDSPNPEKNIAPSKGLSTRAKAAELTGVNYAP